MIGSDTKMPLSLGISHSRKVTRFVADKSSFVNVGGENAMPVRCSTRRSGADPSRNKSGMPDPFLPLERSTRWVNFGNRFFIAPDCNNESGTSSMVILHTRSRRLSAAMIFGIPNHTGRVVAVEALTTMGIAGQISSIFVTGLLFVQRSSRLSQRGEANTIDRHFLHTCTSRCHASSW